MKSNLILVTGCAGFIGFHLSDYLINKNFYKVIGIDNLNDYYDINLKKSRLKILLKYKNFHFFKIDITNKNRLSNLFRKYKFKYVINLAAQAGVRFSLKNRDQYFNANLLGFYNLIELSKKYSVSHFLFASSSSVYGDSKKKIFEETDITDRPLSFYAATKKANEILAFPYSSIYKMKITGMRFFTVYGPYGRPDMAPFKFVEKLINGKKIELYNNGNHFRDFTFVEDVVKSIFKIMKKPSKNKNIPFEIVNIGKGRPQHLLKFLNVITNLLKIKKPIFINRKIQTGDMKSTYASTKKLKSIYNFEPKINIKEGMNKFISWYRIFIK